MSPEERLPRVFLKPGRERSLDRRHPWVFSGAVGRVDGEPAPGAVVMVCEAGGRPRARAGWSPRSQIVGRVWTFDPGEEVDEAWMARRVDRALEARRDLLERSDTNACRLLHAESDGLPGVIADRYGDVVVLQILSAAAEPWADVLARTLADRLGADVFERSDGDVRAKEGLEGRVGSRVGPEPPERVEILEGGARYRVDVRRGHKTGFYLDQRENRERVGRRADGREVLNVFSYTGGFGIAALRGGARGVVNVDASAEALALGEENRELNGFPEARWTSIQGDAFRVLRQMREEGRSFDVVVVDPPKFAESRGQVDRAARGYKDINLQAFGLVRPGGRLFTFSCSGHVKAELFQKIVADAALDAGREGRIVAHLEQAPDHPVLLSVPEAFYLKGLEIQVW